MRHAPVFHRRSSACARARLRSVVMGLALCVGMAASATAQTPPASATPGVIERAPQDGRIEQRVERIRVEDGGSRIDEVRYGGQTQSITVQPKAPNVPPYEINPTDGTRRAPAARDGTESDTGQRVWRVLGF